MSFSVYGACLFSLYAFSTLYHGLRHRAKAMFRRLDHLAIYLLIAGTYTPFALATLRGGWGWSLFGAVWGLAAVVTALEFPPRRVARIPPVVIYLLMGWLVLIALKPLLQALSWAGFVWLLVLYLRRDFLRPGQEAAARARCLASVRIGRQRQPLYRHLNFM